MLDDIGFLVQETFKDSGNSNQSRNFLSQIFSKQNDLPDEVPGFFYHLQKKESTFVIRVHPCENLKLEYKNIVKHPNLYPTLRLLEDEGEVEEKLQYFECDLFNIAKNIRFHLGNKRFPIYEDRVFNVSDPGDSWWLAIGEDDLNIHFKLSQTTNISNLIKLGPLGDSVELMRTFSKLYGYFNLLFQVEDYSSGHGQVHIKAQDQQNLNFRHFKQLLLTGETSHEFWDYLRDLELKYQNHEMVKSIRKANYLMMELAFTRHFWKTIQEQL